MTAEEAKEIMCKVTFYWELGEQTLTQNQINEALDMAIKALEQQPCEDCISRQAVLDLINADWKYEGLETDVASLPPVTLQQKIGHWINLEKTKYKGRVIPFWGRYECSKCGGHGEGTFNYCPKCGARMAESEVEE